MSATKEIASNAQPVSARWQPGQPITEAMHIAAVKVLQRASGVDGLPQRMLDAMLAAAPGLPEFTISLYPPQPTYGMRVGMPTGVKVTHNPSGLFAVSEGERSQHRNREVAMRTLEGMLAAAPAPAATTFCWATELAMTRDPVTLTVKEAREVSGELQRLHAKVATLTQGTAIAAGAVYAELPEAQIVRIYERYGGDMINCARSIERAVRASHGQAPAQTVPTWDALHHAWRKVGADAVVDWGAFTHAVHYAPQATTSPQAAQQAPPVVRATNGAEYLLSADGNSYIHTDNVPAQQAPAGATAGRFVDRPTELKSAKEGYEKRITRVSERNPHDEGMYTLGWWDRAWKAAPAAPSTPQAEDVKHSTASYTLTIRADSGYKSTTEGRCTPDGYSQALVALDGWASSQKNQPTTPP